MGDEKTEDQKNQYGGFETGLEWIQSLAEIDGKLQSPIDINLSFTTPLDLEPLEWEYLSTVPKKIKLTNTGRTLQISASWYDEKPTLQGGPFNNIFEFSQIHFHWGSTDMDGSEHTVDGAQYPLEMHVVFFNSVYLTHEAALKQKDGVAVVVYLFKLHAETNILMQYMLDNLFLIRYPIKSARLLNIPLQFFLKTFEEDYFLYWGSVVTTNRAHVILWLISREPIGITLDQMERFRVMFNTDNQPMVNNFRKLQPLGKRRLFHISPSTIKYASMLPISVQDMQIRSMLETILTS